MSRPRRRPSRLFIAMVAGLAGLLAAGGACLVRSSRGVTSRMDSRVPALLFIGAAAAVIALSERLGLMPGPFRDSRVLFPDDDEDPPIDLSAR